MQKLSLKRRNAKYKCDECRNAMSCWWYEDYLITKLCQDCLKTLKEESKHLLCEEPGSKNQHTQNL